MKQTEKMKKAGREFAPDELSPRQQVAVLMISLGRDNAAEIMKYLTDFEIEDLTHTNHPAKTPRDRRPGRYPGRVRAAPAGR